MARRPVSGCYHGTTGRFRTELRVDVDGRRPTRRISADYYDRDVYKGSMRVDRPVIDFTSDAVTIVGRADFSWRTPFTIVKVSVARVAPDAPRAAALFSHVTPERAPGTSYRCEFSSASFREVTIEEDYEEGVERFTEYDTGILASRGPRRSLSLHAAFDEAGIALSESVPPSLVRSSAAGADSTWSDAELHAAMEQYFSRIEDQPQWAIWLLHARAHDDPRLYGLMFDRRGLHRQGCAVFYDPIGGRGDSQRRRQLFSCVHELGHGFNLVHSWEKSRARPPVPSRPRAASWMNYPQRFPGGERAYWQHFAFEFDDLELAHLRHGFQDDVVMGGEVFGGNAALEVDDPGHGRRRAPLTLRIDGPRAFRAATPVSIEMRLAATTAHGQVVSTVIGPRPGNVDLAILRPDGRKVAFEPLLRHCHGEETRSLSASDRPLHDYAFIHYGKDGFAFEGPGAYQVQARYTAPDGAMALSNLLPIVIEPARNDDDRAVAELLAGNHQAGKQLSLMGSAAPALAAGDRTLQEIVDRYPAHPMAAVARVVRATHLARGFKLVQPDGRVEVQQAKFDEARELITPIIDFDAVFRLVPDHLEGAARERALADALSRVGTRPGVSPAVDSFVNSRRLEIVKILPQRPVISLAPPTPTRSQIDSWLPPPDRRDVDQEPSQAL